MQETFNFRGYDIPVDLAHMTGGGPDTFLPISSMHQAALRKWIDLRPSDRVLEVGCGIGRDAIPLTEFITSGSYVGVDVIAPSIAWLAGNIGDQFDNFRFAHLDISDDLHNPNGTLQTLDVALPAEDSSVDKIFLFSVFTHMFRTEIVHYLKEFERILAPGGMVYATAFIVDDAILAKARETNLTPWQLRFEHEIEPGVLINDPASKRGAVAFHNDLFDKMMQQSGLRVVRYLNGAWSGFHEQVDDGQDVVLLQKSH